MDSISTDDELSTVCTVDTRMPCAKAAVGTQWNDRHEAPNCAWQMAGAQGAVLVPYSV